ncbi:MAG: hypothetical protein M1816_005247 [Peltula sp. TS41687]|nr:MAG: hypothetical protein M1816_005247 [Peltula sp. TS41687]
MPSKVSCIRVRDGLLVAGSVQGEVYSFRRSSKGCYKYEVGWDALTQPSPVISIAISAGHALAGWSSGQVKHYDLENHKVQKISLSNTGRVLAVGLFNTENNRSYGICISSPQSKDYVLSHKWFFDDTKSLPARAHFIPALGCNSKAAVCLDTERPQILIVEPEGRSIVESCLDGERTFSLGSFPPRGKLGMVQLNCSPVCAYLNYDSGIIGCNTRDWRLWITKYAAREATSETKLLDRDIEMVGELKDIRADRYRLVFGDGANIVVIEYDGRNNVQSTKSPIDQLVDGQCLGRIVRTETFMHVERAVSSEVGA